jgi:hypothetical protein
MLEHINNVTKPDLLFWTGDNSTHNTWATTEEEIDNYTLVITNMMKDTLNSDIKIYPSLGNHDTWPVNIESFSKPNVNTSVNSVKDSWSEWIGEEATKKFAEYGYFSIDFKMPDGTMAGPDGSKIIALNTQAANNANFWLLGQREDPGQQMAWLESELVAIEKAGGIAYIIGHVQPHNF